jgi:hypothetical protein
MGGIVLIFLPSSLIVIDYLFVFIIASLMLLFGGLFLIFSGVSLRSVSSTSTLPRARTDTNNEIYLPPYIETEITRPVVAVDVVNLDTMECRELPRYHENRPPSYKSQDDERDERNDILH